MTMVVNKRSLLIVCSCILFLAQCMYVVGIFTRKPVEVAVEVTTETPMNTTTTSAPVIVKDILPGDRITEFIPPFVPLLNDYVITENYNLHACIVRKSMSQLTTNLMCYLSNTALYEDRNRTLSDTWAARKGSCDNIAWSAYAPLYENGTMSMSRMTKLAFIRHPESRFVSFFVEKCINTNSCYGCRDLHCAVKMVYDRLMNHVQNRHLIDQSESERWWFDWHAAPQTWNCDFYKHLTDYHLIKIGTSQKDRKLAMKQLQIALKTANVEDKYIEKIMEDTLVSDTKHGTHQSKSNLRILQQVRTDAYVRHYLHRIYYFDYVAFGFEIPEIYSADLPEYPLRN